MPSSPATDSANDSAADVSVDILNGLHAGGAASAAKTLQRSLVARGADVRFYSASRLGRSDDGMIQPAQWNLGWKDRIFKSPAFRIQRQRFKRMIRKRRGAEIFSSPRGAPATPWPPRGVAVDHQRIIHLHWITKFIDWQSFFSSLAPGQPVVWTLHDMNSFTGGCHFAEGCQRFRIGCGSCPQLPAVDVPPAPENDISRQFFEIKRNALAGINLHVTAPSRWMIEHAKTSPIFAQAKSFHHIPLGLPLELCQPIDRATARAQWELPDDAFVFAFGAADISNRRKGAALLLEAIAAIANREQTGGRKVIGLVFGGGGLPEVSTPHPELRSIGFINGRENLMRVFSACDAFVLPSTEDNLPITGLEALASGTPIVAFDAGGVPDFVRHEVTGLLATNFDVAGLGENLRRMVREPELAQRMGRQARTIALAEYDQNREASDYIALYRNIMPEK